MMENNNQGGGLFSGLGPQKNLQALNPYLNIETSYLQSSAPEYIVDQENKRGVFEKSMSSIGSAFCIGSGVGGVYGVYDGIRQTALQDLTGKLRRTQIVNYTLKGGTSAGNALGSVATIYSLSQWFLSLAVFEEDNEVKSLISGAVTGAFFKSTAGRYKCLQGAGIGLGLATIWAYGIKRQESVQNYL